MRLWQSSKDLEAPYQSTFDKEKKAKVAQKRKPSSDCHNNGIGAN